MLKRRGWLILCIIVLALAMAACGNNKNNNTANENNTDNSGTVGGNNEANNGASNEGEATVDAAAAETVYKKSCIGCHAVDLSGGAGPNLQKVGAEMTVDQINQQISNGGGGMPGFKGQLTDDEIATLSNWLASMK
ncbi:c-type cytochrome [Paenibacillus sp. HB172176]|uniref:c-type cytochrome n=1 Tax=Paenibacillus sp. HB172176 TaxID=2493690 RepID=UPI0023F8CCB4|nr:c-type cytochrome [Paenibacillus sp. HB172176]